MTELNRVIESMASKLDGIRRKLSPTKLPSSSLHLKIPETCYKMWNTRAELSSYLLKTGTVYSLRDIAFKELKELGEIKSDKMWEEYVRRKGLPQDSSYVIQRCFALSKYLMATWALYDRVANVCGRLIGPRSVGDDPNQKRNPKLYSSFFEKEKCDENGDTIVQQNRPDGFSILGVVSPQWKWPVVVSYKIRNLFVHDGAGMEDGRIFNGNSAVDGFLVSENLKDQLLRECFHQNVPNEDQFPSGLRFETDFPWYDGDLINILEKYNSEIDELYSRMLEWCVTAFCSQVEIFVRPDERNLSLDSSLKRDSNGC